MVGAAKHLHVPLTNPPKCRCNDNLINDAMYINVYCESMMFLSSWLVLPVHWWHFHTYGSKKIVISSGIVTVAHHGKFDLFFAHSNVRTKEWSSSSGQQPQKSPSNKTCQRAMFVQSRMASCILDGLLCYMQCNYKNFLSFSATQVMFFITWLRTEHYAICHHSQNNAKHLPIHPVSHNHDRLTYPSVAFTPFQICNIAWWSWK